MAQEYPEKVYKYRNWTDQFHKNILQKNEVYLSSPKNFNDPFDCRIHTNFGLLNTTVKKETYVKSMVEKLKDDIIKRGMNPQERYDNMMRELIHNAEEWQQFSNDINIKLQDDRFGIVSMSAIWDNILMWSHYGDYHKGICVGFHEEKLRNSRLFGKGGPVIYDDNFPEIYPEEELLVDEEKRIQRYYKQTHVKAKNWEYEKEYRLMSTFEDEASDEQRTIILPNDCFKEIILGVNFPKTSIQEVAEIATQKRIPLYQAVKVPFEFKITRELIG